jgi:trans-aconitate methyltransferase
MEIHKIPRHLTQYGNFPFWHSLIKESIEIIPPDKYLNVLDFGTGEGGFLQLFDFLVPEKQLIGVEKDENLLATCKKRHSAPNISFTASCDLGNGKNETIDIAYSQEVIYTLPRLDEHAREMYYLLRPGGYYLATIGCHVDNPTYTRRKERIRATENYPAFDYSLDEVGRSFYDAGFRVSVKRLPVTAPLKYSFEADPEFLSISDLLLSSEQYKTLFVFMKPKHPR